MQINSIPIKLLYNKKKNKRNIKKYKYKNHKIFSLFKCKYINRFIRYFMIGGKLDKAENIIFTVFILLKEAYAMRGIMFFYTIIQLIKPSFIMTPIARFFAGKRVIYIPYRMKAITKYKSAIRIFMNYIKNLKINKNLIAHSLEFTIAESFAVLAFDLSQHPIITNKNKLMLDLIHKKTFLHYRW
jgi:ribosomal protein S7